MFTFFNKISEGDTFPRSLAPLKVSQDIAAVTVNDRCRLYWNYAFPTSRLLGANKPDIVLLDLQTKKLFFIESSAPAETNSNIKEVDKRDKYRDLRFEFERLYPGHSVKMVILIIGSLGGMREANFVEELNIIPDCRFQSVMLAYKMQKKVKKWIRDAFTTAPISTPSPIAGNLVADASTRFAFELYNILAHKSNGNLFFSPLSIHAVLSMAFQGAAGSTLELFAHALHITTKEISAEGYNKIMSQLNNVENVTLLMANKVYLAEGYKMKAAFQVAVTNKFYSEVQSLNFKNSPQAAKVINTWAREKTNGKIPQIFPADAFSDDTRLVLVNAIYFKGDWASKFRERHTKTEPFFIDEQIKVDCQMMHQTGDYRFKSDDNLKANILEMPYKNSQFNMYILLPFEKNGIGALEEKLRTVDIDKIFTGMQSQEVAVSLPKFKIETKVDLKAPLEELGLGGIFDGTDSNFSGMIENREPLKVSHVTQKAYIEVNEEGSEAAVVFSFTNEFLESATIPVNFRCDHPFLINLSINTDIRNILFYGKVCNPVP